MQINNSSGVIYSGITKRSDNNAGLQVSGTLYGEGSNSSTKSSNGSKSSLHKKQVKSGNIVIDSSKSSGNLVFANGKDDTSKQSNTSIDQSTKPIQEDVSKKLEDYRKKLLDWKDKESDVDLINNFGLDMNSGAGKKNLDKANVKESSENGKEFENKSKTDTESDEAENKYDVNRNDREITFEPIAYSKQKKRNEYQSRKNGKNGQSVAGRKTKLKRFSLKKGNKGKLNTKKSKNGKKKAKKRSGKAGKAVKKATKTSLKTSSNATVKGFMAAWGLGTKIVEQDVLFRIILGLFVGTAFVAIVLVGN